MERKLKLGIISSNEAIAHSSISEKAFTTAILGKLPKGTAIFAREPDIDTGSIKLLLYNPKWDLVASGAPLKKFKITLDAPEPKKKSSIIQLN